MIRKKTRTLPGFLEKGGTLKQDLAIKRLNAEAKKIHPSLFNLQRFEKEVCRLENSPSATLVRVGDELLVKRSNAMSYTAYSIKGEERLRQLNLQYSIVPETIAYHPEGITYRKYIPGETLTQKIDKFTEARFTELSFQELESSFYAVGRSNAELHSFQGYKVPKDMVERDVRIFDLIIKRFKEHDIRYPRELAKKVRAQYIKKPGYTSFSHADPHGNNFLITSNERVVLLDLEETGFNISSNGLPLQSRQQNFFTLRETLSKELKEIPRTYRKRAMQAFDNGYRSIAKPERLPSNSFHELLSRFSEAEAMYIDSIHFKEPLTPEIKDKIQRILQRSSWKTTQYK